MRISDWSSDVCASDLLLGLGHVLDRLPLDRDGGVLESGLLERKFERHVQHLLELGVQELLLPVGLGVEPGIPLPNALASGSASAGAVRSEERRVGKEWASTCRSRWSPCH